MHWLTDVAVSQPRLERSSSQHSVTASDDYYSLSSTSDYSTEAQPRTRQFPTPPSHYRTPMQSGERLPRDLRDPTQDTRTTAMRGPGRRRLSDPSIMPNPNPLSSHPRTSPVQRKPVPSTVFESTPPSARGSRHGNTHSSAALEIEREHSPPTPGDDDTPYIHFALDQLTRDEEVRGSRAYPMQERVSQPHEMGAVNAPHDMPREAVAEPGFVSPRTLARQRLEGRDGATPRPRVVVPTSAQVQPSQGEPSGPAVPLAALAAVAASREAPTTPPKHPDRLASPELRAKRR